MTVCVYGASSCELSEVYYEEAFALGAALARAGHTMVFGGGNSGIMGASARGVTSEAGEIIGITPHFLNEPGVLYPHCTKMIFTETMGERKKMMEDISDAFVTLPGGIGTFEEFFEALTLKQLGRHAKAMAILNTNGYYDAMENMLLHAVDEKFFPTDGHALYDIFTDADELISYIEQYKAEPGDIWKEKIFGKYPVDGKKRDV